MKILKKTLATALILAVVLSFAGCTDHTWSVKSDSDTLPAGVYIYYMMTAYNDATEKLEEASSEDEASESTQEVDVLTAVIEGKSGEQWIMDRAREYCKRHIATNLICSERNIVLSEEDKTNVESRVASYTSYYGTMFEQAGISAESLRLVFENSYLYTNLLYAIYDTDGTEPTSEDKIKEYFSDNYLAYKVLTASFESTDSEGNSTSLTDDEIAEIKSTIDAYYKEGNSDGTDIEVFNQRFASRKSAEEVADESSDTAVSETAGEAEETAVAENTDAAQDNGTVEVTALTLNFATEGVTTSYGDDFFENLKSSDVSGYLKIETDDAVYLIQKFDSFSDENEKYDEVRDNCLAMLVEDSFVEFLDKKASELSFVFNENALKEYKVAKLIETLNSAS